MHEQGKSEAPHGDVAGIWLTYKVWAPWDEYTDREISYQFGGGFQDLADVSEVSSCGVAYPD